MSAERTLAARLWARMLRDPKLRAQTGGQAIVCLESDPAVQVAGSIERNYDGERTTIAVYYPEKKVFMLGALRGSHTPEGREVVSVSKDVTIGMQMEYAGRGEGWVNKLEKLSTADLERELTPM